MLQFISLSSGSSGNCYYFNHNGFGLLIDLGISMRALKQHFSNYGLALAQVQAALITHDHTDHVKGIGAFSTQFHIPVYTTQAVHQSIQRNHFVSKKIPTSLQHIVSPHKSVDIGPFNVTPFTVPHDSADNNGYIIRVDDKCIVLLTDVGHFTDEMPDIIYQATHLIIESNYDVAMLASGPYPLRLQNRISSPYGHISNIETAEFLAKHLNRDNIQRVWLCHLSAQNNIPRIAFETCSKSLTEAGFTLEGENANLVLQVLPRKTPTLLTEL